MTSKLTSPERAAFTIAGATVYSGFTRTFLYENRPRLDWIKAGRRSLITRESIDRLLIVLLQQTRATGPPRPPPASGLPGEKGVGTSRQKPKAEVVADASDALLPARAQRKQSQAPAGAREERPNNEALPANPAIKKGI